MRDHEGKPTDGRGLREKLWGKPGDPSGCYFPADWRREAGTRESAAHTCVNHPDRPVRENLDGDDLCQECCDAWVRAEGQWAADQEGHGE